MITNIVDLLQKRKPNAPADWLKKILPDMARRLEDNLYRDASSRERRDREQHVTSLIDDL